MDNGIRFSQAQLEFLGAIIRRNSPSVDPQDDSTAYARQAYRDVASLIESLSDPVNMKRATKPGVLSE